MKAVKLSTGQVVNLDYLVTLLAPESDKAFCKLEIRDCPNRIIYISVEDYNLILRALQEYTYKEASGRVEVTADMSGNIYDEDGDPLPF